MSVTGYNVKPSSTKNIYIKHFEEVNGIIFIDLLYKYTAHVIEALQSP